VTDPAAPARGAAETAVSGSAPLLSVDHLTAAFETDGESVEAVSGVSFDVNAGETVCLVGESGAGKSVVARSIINLLPSGGRITSGRIVFEGRDLRVLDERAMQRIRGAAIGYVFQEPMTALNPVFTIGRQIEETLAVHGVARGREAASLAIDWLRAVSTPAPERCAREYPHELSGGLRQRALIAMALACNPRLLIADEPTTALDVTIQAQILDLLRGLRRRLGLALLLITHDLGVVAEMADRVVVMQAGRVVEQADVRRLFRHPNHAYTQRLLAMASGPAAAEPPRS
jgi:peptide/nickel transport system ATP-binding protein